MHNCRSSLAQCLGVAKDCSDNLPSPIWPLLICMCFNRIMLCQTPQAWCTIAKTCKPTVKAPPVHIWGSPHTHPGLPLYRLGAPHVQTWGFPCTHLSLPLYTFGDPPVHIQVPLVHSWKSPCAPAVLPVPSHVLRHMSEPSRMPAVRVLCLLHLCLSAQVRTFPRDNPKTEA